VGGDDLEATQQVVPEEYTADVPHSQMNASKGSHDRDDNNEGKDCSFHHCKLNNAHVVRTLDSTIRNDCIWLKARDKVRAALYVSMVTIPV